MKETRKEKFDNHAVDLFMCPSGQSSESIRYNHTLFQLKDLVLVDIEVPSGEEHAPFGCDVPKHFPT